MNAARELHSRFQNGKRWIKGDYYLGHSMCLVGALADLLYMGQTDNSVIDNDPAAKAMAEVIQEQYPDRVVDRSQWGATNSPAATIIDFNDNENTTWRDVDKVLEKLAVKLEEMP